MDRYLVVYFYEDCVGTSSRMTVPQIQNLLDYCKNGKCVVKSISKETVPAPAPMGEWTPNVKTTQISVEEWLKGKEQCLS